MRKLRRQQNRKQREFLRAVENSRPNVKPDKLLIDFENISSNNTAKLVEIAMRSLAFASAADYAAEELNNQLAAEDVTFNNQEIVGFARRLSRIYILRRMVRVFKLPKTIQQQIVNLQIAKDFGVSAQSGRSFAIPMSSSSGSRGGTNARPPKNAPPPAGQSRRLNPFAPRPRPENSPHRKA